MSASGKRGHVPRTPKEWRTPAHSSQRHLPGNSSTPPLGWLVLSFMKIPAMILVVLACWMALWNTGGEWAEGITELEWTVVTATLVMAFFASLAVAFATAGRIRLEEEQLVVTTPLGFCKIPYSRVETIRRCRRRGRPQHLQIIFQSLGERKILRIRPRHAVEFAAQLRRKCPQLSSSSDVVLMRNGGDGRLIHSM
jgi:hypothetical protein